MHFTKQEASRRKNLMNKRLESSQTVLSRVYLYMQINPTLFALEDKNIIQ